MFGMLGMYIYQGGGRYEPDFKKMSNIVKHKNKTYFVDTNNTSDHGLETMIFRSKEQKETKNEDEIDFNLIDWRDLYTEYYQSKEEAKKGHKRIVENIGEYLKGDNE